MDSEAINNSIEFQDELYHLAQWAGNRKKNAWVTSLDVFERELGLSRARSVKLARRLDALGFGEYIEGRRMHKSRVKWPRGLFSVADAMTRPESCD